MESEKLRVVYIANQFDSSVNGPAKFAKYVHQLALNEDLPFQLTVVSNDLKEKYSKRERLLYLPIKKRWWLSFFPSINRMLAVRDFFVKKQFDILIFSNGITGIFVNKDNYKTIGFINDPLNILNFENKSIYELIKRTIFRMLEYVVTKQMDVVVSNSKELKKGIIKAYNVHPEKVYNLYKKIDLESVKFRLRTNVENKIHILFVKSDFETGGLRTLLLALSKLSNHNFYLTIAGPSKHKLMSVLSNLKGKNIELNIEGKISNSDVYKLMQKADIFCVPSQKEALGVANIEALAHGLPVVSTNVGGIPEVLDNGHAGWMVNPNDPKELAERIHQCITNNEERTKKSEHGLEHVKRNFDVTYLKSDMDSLIRKVV